MTNYWRRGDNIVLREILRGQVKSGRPYTVVEDTPGRLLLYANAGVRWVRAVSSDGAPLKSHETAWTLQETVWPSEALRIITPGSRNSVLLYWTPTFGEFLQWYVNLEDTLVRTPLGFDYLDQMLDIEAAPDLSQWHWKDEDEFDEAVARGSLTPEHANTIRAEGEQVIAALEARRSPFDEPWDRWRPDPGLPAPTLPEGWSDLAKHPAYGSPL